MKETNSQIQNMAFTIDKAARSLHNSIRYIYAVSMGDFYNVNVKDLFKLSLSDITHPNILKNLGIIPAEDLGGSEFERLYDFLFFAFAVRVPYLRRQLPAKSSVKDRFFLDLFDECKKLGANDPANIVQESFKRNMKSAKGNHAEATFNGEWFRRWVYSYGGELAAITNRNMFLLGCMDALLPLYYAKLTDILGDSLKKS